MPSLSEKDRGIWIRFAWGEAKTRRAAIIALAEEIRVLASVPKHVRESLATLVCTIQSGEVDFGPYRFQWRGVADDETRDVEYRFD